MILTESSCKLGFHIFKKMNEIKPTENGENEGILSSVKSSGKPQEHFGIKAKGIWF